MPPNALPDGDGRAAAELEVGRAWAAPADGLPPGRLPLGDAVGRAAEPVDGRGAVAPVDGRAADVPVEGRAAADPVEGRAAAPEEDQPRAWLLRAAVGGGG
jgi:hypothetical protein